MEDLSTNWTSAAIYIAFSLQMIGFMARDELWLRLLMLGGTFFYLFYYATIAGQPLWDSLITNSLLGAINIVMIAIVLLERTTLSMGSEMAELYKSFNLLSPGQFRRLLRAAKRRTVTEPEVITEDGKPLTSLYFVECGPILIEKFGETVEMEPRQFIGEIAYLKDVPASAKVTLGEGARYLEWDCNAMRRLLQRHRSLGVAMVAQLNIDLSEKVAVSRPRSGAPHPVAV